MMHRFHPHAEKRAFTKLEALVSIANRSRATLRGLAEYWRWTRPRVKDFFKELETMQLVSIYIQPRHVDFIWHQQIHVDFLMDMHQEMDQKLYQQSNQHETGPRVLKTTQKTRPAVPKNIPTKVPENTPGGSTLPGNRIVPGSNRKGGFAKL